MRELRAIQAELDRDNSTGPAESERVRALLTPRMRDLAPQAGRTPLAVDLWLDCNIELPEQVAHDMEAAASALLRLTAQPGGKRAWRDYHAAFKDRYGIGTLVPVSELVNPDTGLGFPAGYPGSLFAACPAAAHGSR